MVFSLRFYTYFILDSDFLDAKERGATDDCLKKRQGEI